mmetsp:Transcript_15253/g.20450  ORF Transcript_15253/g.20450 Transcript_15253/m.20450 type:complete len:224 (-) Transcript_15253:623-1294(-)
MAVGSVAIMLATNSSFISNRIFSQSTLCVDEVSYKSFDRPIHWKSNCRRSCGSLFGGTRNFPMSKILSLMAWIVSHAILNLISFDLCSLSSSCASGPSSVTASLALFSHNLAFLYSLLIFVASVFLSAFTRILFFADSTHCSSSDLSKAALTLLVHVCANCISEALKLLPPWLIVCIPMTISFVILFFGCISASFSFLSLPPSASSSIPFSWSPESYLIGTAR